MNSEKKKVFYAISLVTQIGISMLVPIALCTVVGIKLSEYYDSGVIVPVLMALGMVTGIRNVAVLCKRMFYKDLQKENEKQKYFDDLAKERKKNLGK